MSRIPQWVLVIGFVWLSTLLGGVFWLVGQSMGWATSLPAALAVGVAGLAGVVLVARQDWQWLATPEELTATSQRLAEQSRRRLGLQEDAVRNAFIDSMVQQARIDRAHTRPMKMHIKLSSEALDDIARNQ